jgi:hypothetical protein
MEIPVVDIEDTIWPGRGKGRYTKFRALFICMIDAVDSLKEKSLLRRFQYAGIRR